MSGSISATATTPTVAHGHHHMRTGASDLASTPSSGGTSAADPSATASAGSLPITGGAGTTGSQFPPDLLSMLIGIGNGTTDAVTGGDTGSGTGATAPATTGSVPGATAGGAGASLMTSLQTQLGTMLSQVRNGAAATAAGAINGNGATAASNGASATAAPPPDLMQRFANAAQSFGTFALNTAGEAVVAGAPV